MSAPDKTQSSRKCRRYSESGTLRVCFLDLDQLLLLSVYEILYLCGTVSFCLLSLVGVGKVRVSEAVNL